MYHRRHEYDDANDGNVDARLNNDAFPTSGSTGVANTPAIASSLHTSAAAAYFDNEDDSSITSNSYVTANSSVVDSGGRDNAAVDAADDADATLISNLEGVHITGGARVKTTTSTAAVAGGDGRNNGIVVKRFVKEGV